MKLNVTNYVPKNALAKIEEVLESFPHEVIISRPRKTKLGDFKVNRKSGKCQISINNDLNQYSFLVTLLHELAHYFTYKKHSNSVKPHGKEWKLEFTLLLTPFMSSNIFPENILAALRNYSNNPKASSCSDENLYLALNEFSPRTLNEGYVSEIKPGELFEYGTRGQFKVIKQIRKRILCQHLSSHKKYVFQPITKVRKITPS